MVARPSLSRLPHGEEGRGEEGRGGDALCRRLIAKYSSIYYNLYCTLCKKYISYIDINLCNLMQRIHCLPSKAFEEIERWPE